MKNFLNMLKRINDKKKQAYRKLAKNSRQLATQEKALKDAKKKALNRLV